MSDILRDILAVIGLVAVGWIAVECLRSYLQPPSRRVPRANVRSQRRDWDTHEWWGRP